MGYVRAFQEQGDSGQKYLKLETSGLTLPLTSSNFLIQERLYDEIKSICGPEKLSEEHLPALPFLGAVFHETLRRHSPVPIIPLRYVHEDTKLGDYDIPSGTEASK